MFEWKEATEGEVDEILARYRPDSIFIRNLIKGSLNWSRKCRHTKTTLYLPKDSRFDGSVIATVKGPIYAVAIFSPHRSYSGLLSALEGNGIVDWKIGPMVFCGISAEIFMSFEESLRSIGAPIEDSYVFHPYWLPAEKARKFKIHVPEYARISRLDPSHASTVNSVWPYASKESLQLVTDMISINQTAGLFVGNNDSKLVSWILYTYYGLGMLHTLEEYRRKGFGAMVVKALSKALGEEGKEVTLLVRESNVSASSMFKSLGFNDLGLLKIIQVGSEC